MTDVWQMNSEALMKLGREKEALAALQTAAKLSPGSPQVMMALSEYFMEIGDFQEARRHAEAIGDAGTASPHENLARIALAEGDLGTAEKEARAALERYPARRIPRLILGRVLHDRHDYPGALAEFDLAAKPRTGETAVPLQNLQYLRGDCLARLGRLTERSRDALREPGPRGRGPKGADGSRGSAANAGGVLHRQQDVRDPGRSGERGTAPGGGEAAVSRGEGPRDPSDRLS
jgi:tetratricopeptide (TPR) repeat protein